MILRTSRVARFTICPATFSADITPIGLRLLLNGPRISFRTTQGASRRRNVTKSPNARLLNSYRGLKAGLTSASEVLTQTSFVATSLLVRTVEKNSSINRQLENVLTS